MRISACALPWSLLLALLSACASAPGSSQSRSSAAPFGAPTAGRTILTRVTTVEPRASSSIPLEIARAVEVRISDLHARGGDCSRYGAVLERSYRDGRIVIRPFMWRVGSHLASGEATPDGRMMLAREIDSLNVGIRTVGDVISSMEHEAAHIAFRLGSDYAASEATASQTVRACQS